MTELVVERAGYRVEVAPDGSFAALRSASGELALRLVAALDTVEGRDETIGILPPRVVGDGHFEIERRSTVWERATVTLRCGVEEIDVVASVAGRGRLTDVHVLGGRLAGAGRPTGFYGSGSSYATLFSPNPEDPGRILRSARESVAIGAVGDGEPGRAHWFFTPAPLYLALTTDADEWLTLGVAAPVEELRFPQLVYEAADRAFSLRFEYEGHTSVDGEFDAPAVVVTPGVRDPYNGLREHRDALVRRGVTRPVGRRDDPPWWNEPIFCGWGAQVALGGHAPDHATQARYDEFLEHLERNEVVPGTIVLDDKWQDAYGTNRPDESKWPDLRGWIAGKHARGQHVLLWWKAWDAEGLPAELCITDAAGTPLALDPTNPAAREALTETITRMLAPDGLDADGLKVDFTARTPSGSSLLTHGDGWGIALLHDLLAVVYAAAKAAKPDALVITHTPHPSFVDVTDMIRLNDMLRLNDPEPRPQIVPQMQYRAEVVRAACPELAIDTDDWCAPSLAQWRAYLAAKPLLGVPALYYAQSLDATGETFEARDYAELRKTWERWRAKSR